MDRLRKLVSRPFVLAGIFTGTGIGVVAFDEPSSLSSKRPPLIDYSQPVPSRSELFKKARAAAQRNEPYDLLIIGGGATGVGVALDAQTRGLRVCLVERDDFGSGTSSRSTKLIHGGVRYLEKAVKQADIAQLKLVFEALQERKLMLEAAPHLSRPLPILTPCYEWWQVPYYWAGMKLYDLVAGAQALTWSRFVSAAESQRIFPTLAATDGGHRPPHESDAAPASRPVKSLKGTIVYYDGQFDDSRYNVTLACTAAVAGAVTLNHAEVTGLTLDKDGRVRGARVVDRLTGERLTIPAKVVINAAGPFCDSIRKLADPSVTPLLAPSSGVHVVLPDYYSPDNCGLIVPKTRDGRVVFMLPWADHTVAGTTDAPCEVEAEPRAREEEIEFILEALRDYLSIEVRRSDVLSAWSGIRPLAVSTPPGPPDAPTPAPDAATTGAASSSGSGSGSPPGGSSSASPAQATEGKTEGIVRDHVVGIEGATGMVTVTGGKWTTHRLMAEDTVDLVLRAGLLNPGPVRPRPPPGSAAAPSSGPGQAGEGDAAAHVLPCQTKRMPLLGAWGYGPDLFAEVAQHYTVPHRPGAIDTRVAKHLAAAYGDRAFEVTRLAEELGLGKRIVRGHPVLEAEVVYCCRNELCETPEDFIARRTRMAFVDTRAAAEALPRVVDIMAKEKGWSWWRRSRELQRARRFLKTFGGPDWEREQREFKERKPLM